MGCDSAHSIINSPIFVHMHTHGFFLKHTNHPSTKLADRFSQAIAYHERNILGEHPLLGNLATKTIFTAPRSLVLQSVLFCAARPFHSLPHPSLLSPGSTKRLSGLLEQPLFHLLQNDSQQLADSDGSSAQIHATRSSAAYFKKLQNPYPTNGNFS